MLCFMMWMSGSTLHLFSIMTTLSGMYQPLSGRWLLADGSPKLGLLVWPFACLLARLLVISPPFVGGTRTHTGSRAANPLLLRTRSSPIPSKKQT